MQSSKPPLRVVIPARYGSTRLPGKPMVDLAGKPLIVRVFEAVRKALPDADTVAAVDDGRILAVLADHAIPATMTDPGHKSGTDRAAEIARILNWGDEDIICNVQGDEPLVPEDMLHAFAEFCRRRRPFSMATIAVPAASAGEVQDPNVVKLTLDVNGDAITFSRAPIPFNRGLPPQEWPLPDYLRHVGIYAYRKDILQLLTDTKPCALEKIEKLEQLRALWLNIPIQVMNWHRSPPHGVDTLDDAARVSAIFREREA